MKHISRRQFFSGFLAILGTASGMALLQSCSKKSSVVKTTIPNGVPEGNAMAANLKYATQASLVPSTLRVDKMGTAGNGQFCDNCQFYKAATEGNYGACSLMQNYNVPAKAWCMSWVKKQG
ncbi:MAG: high-potential iron-sulfur protein [Bdellovibrionales bacterium]|nr:high-potential iron-sulfur protein [Bdellovibrionales bacterium]